MAAVKGSLKLKSTEIEDIYDAMVDAKEDAQGKLYEEYKSAYKISETSSMQGDYADKFKSYFTDGTINMINGILVITSKMTNLASKFNQSFEAFETDRKGVISESKIGKLKDKLNNYETKYVTLSSELIGANNEVAKYVQVVDLSIDEITNKFSDAKKSMTKICTDLEDIDDTLLNEAEQLLTEINELKSQITQIMGHCYKDGKLNIDMATNLASQSWYKKQNEDVLLELKEQDPFSYNTGKGSILEDQWATGLFSDVYGYAGYSILGGKYAMGRENGTAYISGSGHLFSANANGQFTDYLKGQANVKAVYGEGDGKIGLSKDYVGFHLGGNVGLASADSSVTLGSDNINGFASADASVCTAEGKVAFEFEKDGQFDVGVVGKASLAEANAKIGFSLLDFDYEEKNGTKKKESLFKIQAGAGVTEGGAFVANAKSKTAYETKFVNINATSIDLEIAAGIDVNFSLTVPTLSVKWPW